MGRCQNININNSLEEVDSNPMVDLERFKTLVEEVTADVAEIGRELKLEVEAEYVIESLQSHGITLMEEELFHIDEQGKWFLEMESIPGKDAVKIVEMTTED